MKHFITAFLLLFVTQGLSAQKHYVRHNAAGMNNGATWYDAFTSLHTALQQAQYGDTIWVAAGTYYPSDTTSRDATFLLPNGVRLFGGFSGIETLLTERDIQLYPAILSGDIGLPGDASDNCYNVLTCHDADSTTVLDGFIIQDGNANSTSFSDPLSRKRGGGMYLKPTITGHETSPEIRHCIFRNNYAGSGNAIFAEGNNQGAAVPDLIYCKFEQNPGTAALFYFLNHPGSHVIKVRHTVWNNNSSADMVMQHLRGAVGVLIENDTFSNSGGGANITFSGTEAAGASTVTLRNSLFYNNTWGKIFLSPSSILGKQDIDVEGCYFIDNQIFEIYSESAKITYTNNHLIDNDRLDFRIYQPLSFDHNIFRQTDFLALWFNDITSCRNNLFHRIGHFNWELYSGADTAVVTQNCIYQANMSVSLTQARFEHCSFIDVGNTADTFNIFRPSKNITLNSCIFSGYQSTPPLIDTLTGPGQWARAVNCVFETPCEGVLYDAGTLVCNGSNVFGVAPMFRDTAGGDFRLLPCSPGINMGDTAVLAAAGISTDLGGAPRVANGMPDAGAFETLLAIRRDTLVHASCDGVANGRVVYGVEACPPFEYQWINGSGMSGAQVDHLAGGQYVVTVTGHHGLILTDTFTI